MTVFDESTESDNPFMTGESDDEAAYDEASAFDDSEGRRRRRPTPAQRRQELARRRELARRQELARTRGPARMAPTAPPGVPAPVAAEVRRAQEKVQDVELETRVQGDAVRGALIAERKRDSSQDLALGLIILSTQLINAFGKANGPLENPVLQAALTAAPVLVLQQGKKSFYKDTRAQVIAGTAAVVVAKHFFDQSKEISVVEFVSPPTTLRLGDKFAVNAIAKNKRGNTLSDVVPVITIVDGASGPDANRLFTATGTGSVPTPSPVILKATAKDKTAAAKEVTTQLVISVN